MMWQMMTDIRKIEVRDWHTAHLCTILSGQTGLSNIYRHVPVSRLSILAVRKIWEMSCGLQTPGEQTWGVMMSRRPYLCWRRLSDSGWTCHWWLVYRTDHWQLIQARVITQPTWPPEPGRGYRHLTGLRRPDPGPELWAAVRLRRLGDTGRPGRGGGDHFRPVLGPGHHGGHGGWHSGMWGHASRVMKQWPDTPGDTRHPARVMGTWERSPLCGIVGALRNETPALFLMHCASAHTKSSYRTEIESS